jgi:tetratricopeptide (TPR) repeat protein
MTLYQDSLLRMGNVERALELSRRNVEKGVGYSKGIELWYDAMLHLRAGRFQKALDDLSSAPPHFDSPVVHALNAGSRVTHALVLELLGDIEGAIALARGAREADYFHAQSRFESARMLYAAGQTEEGDREVDGLELLARDSHSPNAACWLDLARAERHRANGNPKEALSLLSGGGGRVCRPVGWQERQVLLARAAEDSGDFKQAVSQLHAVAKSTGRPESLFFDWELPALYELARVEQRAGMLEEARLHYREFLEQWGDADMRVPIVERAREQLVALGG